MRNNIIAGTDVIKRCRKVDKPTVELPIGYKLYEDEDFVYLLYEDELVAKFYSISVDPVEILKTANQHKQTRQ